MPRLDWYHAAQLEPPHRVTHAEKVELLVSAFRRDGGWGFSQPALVGYTNGATIQLLSGSHRWFAAAVEEIKIPVIVLSRDTVEQAWGVPDAWRRIMELGDQWSRL